MPMKTRIVTLSEGSTREHSCRWKIYGPAGCVAERCTAVPGLAIMYRGSVMNTCAAATLCIARSRALLHTTAATVLSLSGYCAVSCVPLPGLALITQFVRRLLFILWRCCLYVIKDAR